MSDAQQPVTIVRVRGRARAADEDRAAVEEPLEIRLHGCPFAVIMRTPGADRELAAGFLLSERVIRSGDDLGAIEHCTDDSVNGPAKAGHYPATGPAENVVNVTLTNESELDRVFANRRQVTANSSCGLC